MSFKVSKEITLCVPKILDRIMQQRNQFSYLQLSSTIQ